MKHIVKCDSLLSLCMARWIFVVQSGTHSGRHTCNNIAVREHEDSDTGNPWKQAAFTFHTRILKEEGNWSHQFVFATYVIQTCWECCLSRSSRSSMLTYNHVREHEPTIGHLQKLVKCVTLSSESSFFADSINIWCKIDFYSTYFLYWKARIRRIVHVLCVLWGKWQEQFFE